MTPPPASGPDPDEAGWRAALARLRPSLSALTGEGVPLLERDAAEVQLVGWLPGGRRAAIRVFTLESGLSVGTHLAVFDVDEAALVLAPGGEGEFLDPVAATAAGIFCAPDPVWGGEDRHVLFAERGGVLVALELDLPGRPVSAHPLGTHVLCGSEAMPKTVTRRLVERKVYKELPAPGQWCVVRCADRRVLRRGSGKTLFLWSCDRLAWDEGDGIRFASLTGEDEPVHVAAPGLSLTDACMVEDGRIVRFLGAQIPQVVVVGPEEPGRAEVECPLDAAPSRFTLSVDGRRLLAEDLRLPARTVALRLDRPASRPVHPRPPPDDGERTHPGEHSAIWHPLADVLAARCARPDRLALIDADGTVLREIPTAATPVGWTPDGRGLLVAAAGTIDIWTIGAGRP